MKDSLHTIALICLLLGGLCALIVVSDLLAGHKQHMWVMNIVWPMTALYAGPLALWAYFSVGRLSTQGAVQEAKARDEDPPGKKKPFWQMVALGASHCGAAVPWPISWRSGGSFSSRLRFSG